MLPNLHNKEIVTQLYLFDDWYLPEKVIVTSDPSTTSEKEGDSLSLRYVLLDHGYLYENYDLTYPTIDKSRYFSLSLDNTRVTIIKQHGATLFFDACGIDYSNIAKEYVVEVKPDTLVIVQTPTNVFITVVEARTQTENGTAEVKLENATFIIELWEEIFQYFKPNGIIPELKCIWLLNSSWHSTKRFIRRYKHMAKYGGKHYLDKIPIEDFKITLPNKKNIDIVAVK